MAELYGRLKDFVFTEDTGIGMGLSFKALTSFKARRTLPKTTQAQILKKCESFC